MPASAARAAHPDLSIVIPAFNSAAFVDDTLDACVAACERAGLSFEIVAVNDGSVDGSWQVLRQRAMGDARIVAVDLLRNYGQHAAVWCGLERARGRRVVTLDDDLQNPPDQIGLLLAAADDGADVVFGRPYRKRHGLGRRVASAVVDRVNTRVFRKPHGLVLTNFRLLDRAVVDRMLAHPADRPYVNGLAVLHARRAVNVAVEHHPRRQGRSGYDLGRALALVATILFGYSAVPLRWVSAVGVAAAMASLGLGAYFLGKRLLVGSSVPGWASVVVLLSFFNGLTLLLLGMLGEYTVRLVRHVGALDRVHVVEVVERGTDDGAA
jgi:glycosyltransferase involved in cell wall biosynthesis